MNFWKQTTHVMSYFDTENLQGERRLPENFIQGFLEASTITAGQRDTGADYANITQGRN